MTLVRKSFSMQVDGPSRKRGRVKMTWMEVVRIYPKKCNLFEDLALDRPEWRNSIHVADYNLVGPRLEDLALD